MFPGYTPGTYRTSRAWSTATAAAPTLDGGESTRYARSSTADATATISAGAASTAPSTSSPDSGIDSRFDLPPVLVTCLVRHTDGQHRPLATPAVVERCLRDLQRRLHPWVPVERVFGTTMHATTPTQANTSAPAAGTFMAGSRVRLQLAKTTDIGAVVGGTSALHLLFYAVDEAESKPAALAQMAQDWRSTLTRNGEGDDCLVLLVHRDIIASAEAASRLAEEAQHSGAAAGAEQRSAPSPATAPAPAPAVSQARVDAAAAQVGRYYRELRDMKFSPQQIITYMPSETPTRLLERLRPAVMARGARLRHNFEACAAQKRELPLDPRIASSAGAAAAASAARPPSPRPCWSVQGLWRCGYALAVFYLQYGLVVDARAVLERLFLEYFNSSDDYVFLRSPVATLQRLGRVPNLFDARGHAGWSQSKLGHPRGLDDAAEPLEGLLLVASAEMACSLLLGDAAAAMVRYHAFMQVTREKFDEWSAAEARALETVTEKKDSGGAAPTPSLRSATYQQFFLLQCYLSGLRLWWPTGGLCQPRRGEVGAAATAAAALGGGGGGGGEERHSTHPASFLSLPLARLPSVHRSTDDSGAGRASPPLLRPLSLAEAEADIAPVLDVAHVLSAADDALAPQRLDAGSDSGVRYSMTNPSFAVASGGASVHSLRFGGAMGSFGGRSGGERSATRLEAAEPVPDGTGADTADADADGLPQSHALLCGPELGFLLSGSAEETAQMAITYLVDLATATGLLAENMEAALLLPDSTQTDVHHTADADGVLSARALQQQRQRQLRRKCVEAATLLEHAKDALAAVAHDLGYSPFSHAIPRAGAAPSNAATDAAPSDSAAAATAFSNVEELSSPEQALRLWRVLSAMAALALRLGEQRRREFHIYARLAMTLLIDHPSAAANIVAARLLPYVKRHGWRRIELFVRRLYVEACERLMLRAGLLANGGLAAAVATMTARASQTRLWRRVFHTSAAYALYRECVLVLLSNSGGDDDGGDGGRGGDVVADHGVAAAEDVVGSLDSRLFSLRTRAVWWRELLRIDALVMGIVFTGEPLEYPLEYFTSPMTVRVVHKTGAAEAGRSNDSVDTINETSATVPPGVLQVGVEDLVQITFSSVFSIDPLARPAFAGDDAAAEAAASGVRFQLALESRKEWTDEEEAVHEVHIRDAAAVHFDAVTRRLRVSFDFPVCHAGVYRVRRLRLCNGSTWLAAYPQHTAAAAAGSSGHPDGGGIGGSSGGWASCLRALSWNASSTPRPMRVLVEPLYQPAGRAALLRVTEPRSSVHLRLTLPREAHCFADSVDYVTLEVDLEDPLEIKSATADATHAIATAASAPPLDAAVARKAGARAAAAAAAECTCSFDLSSTDLRLPLSASAPVRGRHAPLHGSGHYAPLSVVNSGSSGALQRRASASSMAFHSLLPPLDDSANGDGVGGPADAPRVAAAAAAAVVLGTPAAYRTRSATAAATRSALGTSFASLSVAGLGSSFAARAGQPTDALALSRRGAPLSTSPGEAHEPMHAGHTGQQLRYKSVFKSLRLGASLAASMSGVHADVATPTTATRGVGHSGRTTPRLEQLPECSGPEGQTGDERARRGPAVGGTPTASPLRAVAADMLELVLVHSEMAWQEDSASAAPSHGSRAAAAATAATAATTAARTVVPIHLGTYLANLPAPEVQVAAPRTAKDGTAASAAATLHTTAVLRAQSHRSADPLRETVIQFLPRHHDAAAAEVPPDVAVTHMRLRLPLLPLLTTSTTAAALASARPGTVVSSRAGDDVGGGEDAAAPSAAVVAHQARISFTCVRGREPCTRTLHATLPFAAAVSFDYTFKHFQGRVYCLVRMQNKLTCTSLWLRGAVLRVLDAEPSYEIVRVCEVYNELLLTEWKPREELHILYELDLVASFHPAQPECAHRVQMEVFYSSWRSTFLTTSPEDRLVLRTMELPPTEATAESVEVIHSDVATHDDAAAAARETPAPHHADPRAVAPALHRSSLARSVSVESSRSASVAPITHTHRSASSGTDDDDDDGDPVGNGSVGSRGSGCDSVKSRTAASSAVHFNVVTLRHLEETVNTVWGPVATFRSKHLCVFSIVMHAESPWTMRFGAAVNYSAPPPTTPLTAATGGGGGPASRSAVHAAGAASATAHPSTTTAFAGSLHSAPASRASVSGGGGDGGGGGRPGGAATSLFGNAMVDQPSDVVFVAGEPVRFCVRLQPQAQNWPEDADMEETFFIRLKYNPAQWMVIGKQRDRRALSLMEEVTVYFNAVPLLPIASTAGGTTATPLPSRTAASDRAVRGAGAATGPGGRGGEDSDADDDDQEDEDGDLGAVRGGVAGRPQRRRPARPLAGHGVEDEGILQTPTVEMFWERKTPPHSHAAKGASSSPPAPTLVGEGATSERPPPTHADAVMGEAVLVDVVQFRTWVRVRKRGH